ncbi:MAG: mechanosensitive ion channel family protein [Candidatus Pacearchaeota archaeon]|nr:mechanosensitive ion channel family protein [Candidatus Pacearchaeota archaeon]
MAWGLENYIVNDYLRAFVVLLIVFAVVRAILIIIEKIAVKLTSKTKTDVDDKFITKTSKPITALVFLIGIRVAVNEILLTEYLANVINQVIWSFIVVCIGFIVYYFIDIVLFVLIGKAMKGESNSARKSLMGLLHSIMQVVFIAIVLLYILEVWGIQIGPFLAALGIAGLAVALALQPAMSNIFSGVSIILDKSVKVGDLIYLDDTTRGRVNRIGLRSTRIITFDNELIIVPNSKVADNRIQNIGEPELKTRVVIPFGVAYGSDVDKVKKVVLAEIRKIKHFISEPEPVVRFLEMANSSLNFKAYFYVDSYENKWIAIDEANTRIYNILNKNKVLIPFPQMDVYLKREGKK